MLPEVQRDLYEDVDGERATGSNSPDPEESPLLPGSVKMHRKANTLDHENLLFIWNNFNQADFVNFSPEIDFNLKYSDSAFIHKSNGMITQSNASFSQQLNFGEPIHFNNSHQEKLMKVTMISQVSLIELTNYFEEGEIEKARVHLFVRLSLPKSKATISLKENQHNFSTDAVSNSSVTPSQNPLVSQTHNSSNSSSTLLQRSRRSSNLEVDQSATLFEKKVLGIIVKAEVRHWVQQGVKMGINVVLSIGSYNEPILNKEYTWKELQNQQPTDSSISWRIASLVSACRVLVFVSH